MWPAFDKWVEYAQWYVGDCESRRDPGDLEAVRD